MFLPIPSSLSTSFDVLRNILRNKKEKILKIDTGNRKYGFNTATRMMTPDMLKIFCAESSIDLGNSSSIALKLQGFVNFAI